MKRALIGLLAWAVISTAADAQTVGTCSPALADAYLDIGNVRARILNNGNLFYRGEPHVYNVPKGSVSNALFAGSLWIAGMVDGTLRLAASTYGPYEFWPGPLDEGGNPPADCAAYDRLYRVSKADVETYEATGTAGPDLADWPTGLGAPTVDAAGKEIDLSDEPLAERRDRRIDLSAGERPAFLGDQMIWWVMNDMGNIHDRSKASPVGIEVHGLAFAFEAPGAVGNATFYRYRILKKGPQALTGAFVGLFSDPDMGDFADDWIGTDSTLGLAYAWNSDNFDGGGEGFGTPPPAVGYDLFQGPLVPSPGSNARAGPRLVPGYRNVPVTTAVYFNNGGGVTEEPSVAVDFFNYLTGFWKDGKPFVEGGNAREYSTTPVRFVYSGDAANCGYWTECYSDGQGGRIPPGDRKFVISSGPFSIDPGGEQEILWGVVYGRGKDHFDSVTALKEADVALQAFVDSWFTEWPSVPETPAKPVLSGVPGDGVTGQPLRSHLEWECPPDAVYCRMQWDYEPSFGSPTDVVYSNSTDLVIAPHTRVWWRIRGIGRDETPGPWSDAHSFTTGETVFGTVIQDFAVISNAAGPLDPPECGAFAYSSSGFPLRACGGNRPDVNRQQTTARVAWGIHAKGAGIPFGPLSAPTSFTAVSTGGQGMSGALAASDWEVRFTLRGGKALRQDGTFMSVPFEVWRTGRNTPDDPSDDIRVLPVLDDANTPRVFDIGGDHAISSSANDPITDAISLYLPEGGGGAPGEGDYEAWVAGSRDLGPIVLRDLVFVCENCGTAPPYPAPHPETGTTFRISTVRAERPILAAPSPGGHVVSGEGRFWWTAQADVGVGIQFAAHADFADPIVDLPPPRSAGEAISVPPGTWWWRVGSADAGWSQPWVVTVAGGTAVSMDGELPTSVALDAIWPNPFNPLATIRFGLPADAVATVDVVDVLGRRVAVIDAGARRSAGWHTVQFDGSRLASGVYFVRLAAGGRLDVKSVVLLK